MSYPVRPFFEWGFVGDESELTLELPQEPWSYAIGGVGGSATAASGTPESYRIRDDDILLLRPRVLESEMPAFKVFLRWARNYGEPFTIRLDAGVPATEFSVYLDSQRWEDAQRVEMTRDGESRIHFVVPIAVRPELGGDFAGVSWDALTQAAELESES